MLVPRWRSVAFRRVFLVKGQYCSVVCLLLNARRVMVNSFVLLGSLFVFPFRYILLSTTSRPTFPQQDQKG
jgi:hypothetical protein